MMSQSERFARDRETDERRALGTDGRRSPTWRRLATGPHRGSMRVLPRAGDGTAAPEFAQAAGAPECALAEAAAPSPSPATGSDVPRRVTFVAGVAVPGAAIVQPRPRREPTAPSATTGRVPSVQPLATGSVRAASNRMSKTQIHQYLTTALEEARQEAASQAQRIADLEDRLRGVLQQFGHDTTETRNLKALVKSLEPLAERVRSTDLRLDAARLELRSARSSLDAEVARRQAAEADAATLRSEVDWRDYVIRDLEPMADRVRLRDRQIVRMDVEHAATLAARDAEISRLRALLGDAAVVAAPAAT